MIATARQRRLPTPRTMHAALLRRDPAYVGVFWFGVQTTGVFCLPTCAARRPKPRNVRFFADVRSAMQSGFRPCKRCKPIRATLNSSPIVRALVERVERNPAERITARDLAALGIDEATARRHFQRSLGMTFQQYQRTQRLASGARDVQQGATVTLAALDAGYESLSGFGAAFQKAFHRSPRDADHVSMLTRGVISTPLGEMTAVGNEQTLLLLEFSDRRGLARELKQLEQARGATITPGRSDALRSIEHELAAYFSGKLKRFTTPIELDGSPFERSVWRKLQEIPHGATRSYAELASELGRPGAQRAVGRANGRNRLALIVPCHRVVRSDGELCGYAGGIWRKRALLAHERGERPLLAKTAF